jgi:hypothetical protein
LGSEVWIGSGCDAIPVAEYQCAIQGDTRLRHTGIGDNDIQSISNLLDFFHCLLVAFCVVCDQLDDLDVRVFAGELVQLVGRRGITSASKYRGRRDTVGEGVYQVETDTSACTRD